MPTPDEVSDLYTGPPPAIDDRWIAEAEMAYLQEDAERMKTVLLEALKWIRFLRPSDDELRRIYYDPCFAGAPDFAHHSSVAQMKIAGRVLRGWRARR